MSIIVKSKNVVVEEVWVKVENMFDLIEFVGIIVKFCIFDDFYHDFIKIFHSI